MDIRRKTSSPISRVLSGTVIHLGSASPQTSSNLPESSAGHAIGFLFGLAPGGVYHRRGLLPATRCALTAPFQPYRRPKALRRYTFCCTFRRLAPPRRYLAPCPAEPGLSSPGKTGGDCLASSAATIPAAPGACKNLLIFQRKRPLIKLVFADTADLGNNASSLLHRQLWDQQSQQTINVER